MRCCSRKIGQRARLVRTLLQSLESHDEAGVDVAGGCAKRSMGCRGVTTAGRGPPRHRPGRTADDVFREIAQRVSKVKPVTIDRQAEAELLESVAFYESRLPGLGLEFESEGRGLRCG